jgi:holo-[acyl-carrier protein] synthase
MFTHSGGTDVKVADSRVSVRVGTDVEAIADVESALARFGARYARRLFTPHEISSCGGLGPQAAPGLAARFAAKEAMIKVLRPTEVIPRWRSIEVRRHTGGWTDIALSDEAADLARMGGISDIAVSLSHGAGVGTATVVALTGSPDSK